MDSGFFRKLVGEKCDTKNSGNNKYERGLSPFMSLNLRHPNFKIGKIERRFFDVHLLSMIQIAEYNFGNTKLSVIARSI